MRLKRYLLEDKKEDTYKKKLAKQLKINPKYLSSIGNDDMGYYFNITDRKHKEYKSTKFIRITNEVYMSKSLSRDLDKSRNKKPNKFAIMVDGFSEEETKTIRSANTKRAEWIRFYMRNNRVDKPTAEKAVIIKEI